MEMKRKGRYWEIGEGKTEARVRMRERVGAASPVS